MKLKIKVSLNVIVSVYYSCVYVFLSYFYHVALILPVCI